MATRTTNAVARSRSSDRDPDRNVRIVVQMLMTATETDAEGVAVLLGVARSGIYERLNGKRHFTVRDLHRLAEHFEVDPGVFFAEPRELLQIRSDLANAKKSCFPVVAA